MRFSGHRTDRTPRPRRRRLSILSVTFAALAGLPAAGVFTASTAEAGPAISIGPCTSATWVHVDSSNGLHCYAHPGTWPFDPVPELYTFCSGNNHGSFTAHDAATGKTVTTDFPAGFSRSYANGLFIESLTITGGSGSDSC